MMEAAAELVEKNSMLISVIRHRRGNVGQGRRASFKLIAAANLKRRSGAFLLRAKAAYNVESRYINNVAIINLIA